MQWGWGGRIFVLFLVLFGAGAEAHYGALRQADTNRLFWVKKNSEYLAVRATLQASGERSSVYVEDSLWVEEISPAFVRELMAGMEKKGQSGSLFPELGLVPLQEKLFGPLPRVVSPDERLVVLITDLGASAPLGYFSRFDQMGRAEAEARGARSNEANIVYLNSRRRNLVASLSQLAQELQKLLGYHHNPGQDLWFQETLGKAAALAAGFYGNRAELNQYALQSSLYPLVSLTKVQEGPQMLFASFLLDSMSDKQKGLALVSGSSQRGRETVETLFREGSGSPMAFDLIFSKFLSYLFMSTDRLLPESRSVENRGLRLPPIRPYARISGFPASLRGELMPYSVLVIDLPRQLPPTAVVKLEPDRRKAVPDTCSAHAILLWKPIHPTRIAVYAVGCEHRGADDKVQFHLSVLDKPSL